MALSSDDDTDAAEGSGQGGAQQVCVSEAMVETSTRVRKGYGMNCNSPTACTMVLRC
jgi:hypothetical protein